MKKTFLLMLLLFYIIQPVQILAKQAEAEMSFLVKSSGNSLFQTVLTVQSNDLIHALTKAKSLMKVSEIPSSNNYLLIEDNGIIRIFIVDDNGAIYDEQTKEKIAISPNITKKIKTYFKVLQAKHFGEIFTWEEVNSIIPRYTTFRITDIETGLQFQAQRRAGSNHADVQPLTETDTKIMKRIYGGKWSWNRRAILIHYQNHVIAASMHGMPHGRGALKNGFPGHFCIHFKDSLTHSTKSLDLSHQVMVYKAAGLLGQFVKEQSPEAIIELFFIAVNHHDEDLLSHIYSGDVTAISDSMKDVEMIRMVNKLNPPLIKGDVLHEIPIVFKLKELGKSEVELSFTFTVKRDSPTSAWELGNFPLKHEDSK